jgi:hypothetical protein
MTDIVPASDPRVRVYLTFHPEGKDPLTVSLPRWDFLDEATVRDIKAALRRIKQDAEKQADEIRRTFRRYQTELRKHQKALNAWEKRLDDPEIDDPGEEPIEPERPDFGDTLDEREAERISSLKIFEIVLSKAEYRVVEKCTTAELVQARKIWDKATAVPLGELLASPTSSTESTEGPSERTCSAEDGQSETSDESSPGETSETS